MSAGPPRPGPGHTVTGIFRHYADSVLTLTTSSGDEIGVTSNHPVWSADRQSFVRAGDLRPGETLRHLSGSTTLQTVTRRLAGALVYNLEIETSHVYHVSKSGLLVHNTGDGEVCDLARKAVEKATDAAKGTGGIVTHLEGNIPDAVKWIQKGGRVIHNADGTIRYIKNGVEIIYDARGFPDFAKYLYKGTDGLGEVTIELATQGSKAARRRADEAASNLAAGFKETPTGYVWHHHEEVGRMQLVLREVHEQFWHKGGFSLAN